jgi:osmoprotectant transport system permease protein
MTEALAGTWDLARQHPGQVVDATVAHLQLVGLALGIAIVTCVPLGLLTSRSKWAALSILGGVYGLRVIPSLAVLFLAVPYLGLGYDSAALAVTFLALPPVLLNTDAAFRGIDPALREAAVGLGMSSAERLRQVEIPLALPTVMAGIRTAATEAIASSTLAAFVGFRGLGHFVVLGFNQNDASWLLLGALPVAALALAAEVGLGAVERRLRPPG